VSKVFHFCGVSTHHCDAWCVVRDYALRAGALADGSHLRLELRHGKRLRQVEDFDNSGRRRLPPQ